GVSVCRERESTQPVRVRPKEVSVHLGSYPGDGRVTVPIEALGTEVRLRGGPASVRAATRVKPEQASKMSTRAPSLLISDDGRRGRPDAPTSEGCPARRGRGRSTYAHCHTESGIAASVPAWPSHRAPVGASGFLLELERWL